MPDKYVNKVVYNNETKIDLTADTITAADLASGVTAHDKSGAPITGTNTYDIDSSEATAAVAEILAGKTAAARGVMLTGTMPNNGAVSGTISTKAGTYSIPQGYHDGSGTVAIDATEQAKIIPGNIKAGVEILGEIGTYSGESISAQTKNVTPTAAAQTILPDAGYDYMTQVNVAAIPYVETENSAGGITVTIG
ncbi:MAG: hypothetical protein J6N15_04245 [Ruminiclostridium sp.]|nr:hypothetical protein [Ruminiclostridium sp.]